MDEKTLAAQIVDRSLGLAAVVIEHVPDDDLCALLGEYFGLGGAHSPGPATDESNLILQPHSYLLPV